MCGIIGIYSFNQKQNVVPALIKGLMDLQHRGELSAGITTYNPDRKRLLQTYKDNGKVDEVFRINHKYKLDKITSDYAGHIGIGHTRYATSGDDSDSLAQPFERPHGRLSKWFSISFNGNLANYSSLKKQLEDIGYNMTYDSDTEVIMHYLSREMQRAYPDEPQNFTKILNKLSAEFDGAWNICFINAEGKFFASRGHNGIRPLCYGIKDNMLVVCSESVVLSNLQIEALDIPAGHVLVADATGYEVKKYSEVYEVNNCFFEYIYFAHDASKMDNSSIYNIRYNVGNRLAAEELQELDNDYIVVPVPDTSYIAGSAYATATSLPYVLGIIKNQQIGRTFIANSNREERVRQKFTFIKEVLENKKIILVDDSIVRGSTLKNLVKILKNHYNVREVHLRIGCPPITNPCFYGIDFPTIKELYAGSNNPDPSYFGADSLQYLSYDGLLKSIGKDKTLCKACLGGEYPTLYGLARSEGEYA